MQPQHHPCVICIRRLKKHGLRVLVERPVAASECPDYEPFQAAAHARSVDLCITLGGAWWGM